MAAAAPDILTPDQAADHLQVDREMVYRCVPEGRLLASGLGRGYRLSRRNVELLLWTTRTRPDIALRDSTPEEIARFLRLDKLGHGNWEAIRRFAAGLASERS